MHTMNIVVIGSGFGGLAAAIRLQAQGHHVTMLERRDKPGGRAYVYQQDGFTFDGGPTIITAPWLIDELFEIAGKKTSDYVTIVPITPFYNIRFENGDVFRYSDDLNDLLRQIQAWNPSDVTGYQKFRAATEEIFKTGMALIDQPFTHATDMLRVAPDLLRLQSYKSVGAFVNKFIKDDRLRQVFSFHPLLIGGNPFQSSSLYTLIHTLEQRWGVWFTMGGTGALVNAFVTLFTDLGGTLHLNADVSTIDVDDITNRTTGVRLQDGTHFPADAVVSNADIASTYLHLIHQRHRRHNTDKHIKRLRYSMSLFVLYFGTNKKYETIAHHEILLGNRYKPLLDDIFTNKILADDFSLYLHRPTATDPSLAPPNCDAWYVLSPVPHLESTTDWTTQAKPYRDKIVAHLERHYLPNLSHHIVTEHHITPIHFHTTLKSHLGSAFSVEPILTQSAWFRPHNQSEDIPNLYCTGAGTHPGAGLPGVLSSGKIVANMIQGR